MDNIEEKEKLEKDPLEFYDIIVNINSMQRIKKEGWEIRMNETGKKISEDKNEKKKLIIGVLGNKNKGKSFKHYQKKKCKQEQQLTQLV